MAYTDILAQQQQKVKDLIASHGQNLEAGMSRSTDMIDTSRAGYAGGVGDLLSGYDPSMTQLGVKAQLGLNRGLKRKSDEKIDLARMNQKRQLYTVIFNNAFNQLVQSGADLNTANARAREMALERSDMEYQAKERESNRNFKIVSNNLQLSGQRNLDNLKNQSSSDPYEQAVLNALTQTTVSAGGAYAFNKGMAKKPATTTAAPTQAGAGGNWNQVYDQYYPQPPRTAGTDSYYGG